MNKSTSLAIVGCGWAAGALVRAASQLENLAISSVFDTDAARASSLAEKAGARVAPDLAALLSDPGANAVYVGLPHALLPGVVAQALTAGKHVLSEKPLALTASEARQLGQKADALGLKLAVFFELRQSGIVQTARRLIAQDSIGAPSLIRIRTMIDKKLEYWGQPGQPNWRARRAMAGGGVVMMNSIHQLDTLRFITGLDVVRASAELATFTAPAEVEDAASASLTLSNGAIVSLVASAHSPGAANAETIEIDGTKGRLDLPDPFGTKPVRLYRSSARRWQSMRSPRTDCHLLMLKAFVDAIENDTPVPAGATDAAAALGVVEAIYAAAASRTAVTI